jgi:hypothetical protein
LEQSATVTKSQKSLFAQLEAAFITWIRRNGRSPDDAVALFVERSPYMEEILAHLPAPESERILQASREHLARISGEQTFKAQFPSIHYCRNRQGRELRYTITLTIGENEASWIGRVWADDEYLGEVTGAGSGPKANYLNLARMHIESQIDCEGALVRRPLPDYW